MEQSQLFIPKKIKVGYQKRDDTYTKKLAYVTYFDDKGVLRKEKSWEGWRQKNIKPDEYDNTPTEGFVLNKGVGGQRESYGWNARNEYIRVYDPRGFEFEISVSNLLYILQEATSTKGKGLEGEFVYSWDGKELVLVPVDSEAYRASQEYTKLQSKKVTTKELVLGCAYRTKKQEDLIYLGRFDWYTLVNPLKKNWRDNKYDYYHKVLKSAKMYIFLNEKKNDVKHGKYVIVSTPSNISICTNDIPVSNYAELMDTYLKDCINASKPVGLELKPKKITIKEKPTYVWDYMSDTSFVNPDGEDTYTLHDIRIQTNYEHTTGKHTLAGFTLQPRGIRVTFKNGLIETKGYEIGYQDKSRKAYSEEELRALGLKELVVNMDNGRKIKFNKYNF